MQGKSARRLRQRGQREGERRDDERDARHARPRQAPRRLRHRDEARTSSSTSAARFRVDDPHPGRHRQRCASRSCSTCSDDSPLHRRRAAPRHGLPGVLPHPAGRRSRSRRRSSSTRTSSRTRSDASCSVARAHHAADASRETGDTVDLKPFAPVAAEGRVAASTPSRRTRRGQAEERLPDGRQDGRRGARGAPKPARVLVISSSQFLANPFARAGNGPDMGQMGMMMPGMGGDEKLQQIAGPYAQQILHEHHPRVQEHARLAHGRHRSPRGRARRSSRSRTSPTATSRSRSSSDETEDQLKKQDEDDEEGAQDARSTGSRACSSSGCRSSSRSSASSAGAAAMARRARTSVLALISIT